MDKSKAKYLKKAIIFLAIFLLILVLSNPAVIPFTSAEFKESAGNVWSSLFGDVDSVAGAFAINWITIFKLLGMIFLLSAVNYLVKLVLAYLRPKTARGMSALSFFRSLESYIVVILGIVWGLSIIGVNVTAIFAGVGVMALVISFGAESLVEDVITGVFLAMDQQFNVGDIIEVDGFRGTVEQIGVRSTYIKDAGGNVQIINNASIKKVLNRSAAASRAVCDVSVSYSADIPATEKVLGDILASIPEKYPDTFKEAPVYLGVQELGSSAVVLRVVATVNETDVYSAQRLLNREVKIGLDAAGIEIPFPQVVVHNARD